MMENARKIKKKIQDQAGVFLDDSTDRLNLGITICSVFYLLDMA